MKRLSHTLAFALLIAGLIFSSCKKPLCETCPTNPLTGNAKKPPIALAGADHVITLPTDSILLDGSASGDPDGTITAWQWTRISGPSSFTIVNPNFSKTQVNNLAEGIYLFELKVTDNEGQSANDTMKVTVNQQAIDSLVDVYVAGSEWNGTKNIAKYWKNGTSVSLTDGSNDALATAMAISGSDIHVIGYEINGNITVARYWKNGTPVFLTDGYSRATAIATSGSDVYVAGFEYSGNGVVTARYWKNGIPITLTGNPPAAAIAISGNDIYVAGSENDGDAYHYTGESGDTVYANYSVVKYWKNGTPVTLSDGSNNAVATSIAVSGSDVYVTGWEYDGNGFVAKYWKNGTPVTLTNGNYSYATGIAISDNNIYVSGWGSHDYGVVTAKYWKNGTHVTLTTNSREPHATAIAISGNNVYVAGYDYDYGGTNTSVARYWRNGVVVSLTSETSHATANSIVVLPR